MSSLDKIDGIGTFTITASGIVAEIPYSIGRRDYIQISNNSAVDVKILPSVDSLLAEGFLIKASGGVFSDYTNAPIYIQSTAAEALIHIYERKNK